MTFALGKIGRSRVAATGLALVFGLAACSGSDDPEAGEKIPSSTAPSVNEEAANEAQVADLLSKYWAVSAQAQNTGDDSPGQFDGVAKGSFIEVTLKSIRSAKADGVKRTGKPEISDVEVAVTGDSAEIMACLNEDDWLFVKDGVDLKFEKRGKKPWGAEATRSDDSWQITDVRLPSAV